MVVEYREYTVDLENMKRIAYADWIFAPNLNRDGLIVGKSEPDSDEWEFKLINVEDSNKFIFDFKKTKINAMGGVIGLVEYMDKNIKQDFATSNVERILKYAWNNMKSKRIGGIEK